MGGNVGRGQDGGWWWWEGSRGDEGSTCYGSSLLRSTAGGLTGGWEHGSGRRSAVLPVAVGHGILSLLLLEELRDGQQLFQHVLGRRNGGSLNRAVARWRRILNGF